MKTFDITIYATVEYNIEIEAETKEAAEEEAYFSFTYMTGDMRTEINETDSSEVG